MHQVKSGKYWRRRSAKTGVSLRWSIAPVLTSGFIQFSASELKMGMEWLLLSGRLLVLKRIAVIRILMPAKVILTCKWRTTIERKRWVAMSHQFRHLPIEQLAKSSLHLNSFALVKCPTYCHHKNIQKALEDTFQKNLPNKLTKLRGAIIARAQNEMDGMDESGRKQMKVEENLRDTTCISSYCRFYLQQT